MIVIQVVVWGLGAFVAYLGVCFIVGFISGMAQSLGLQRRPRFRIVRCEEETD